MDVLHLYQSDDNDDDDNADESEIDDKALPNGKQEDASHHDHNHHLLVKQPKCKEEEEEDANDDDESLSISSDSSPHAQQSKRRKRPRQNNETNLHRKKNNNNNKHNEHILVGSDDGADNEATTSVWTRRVPHIRGNWAGHVFVHLDGFLGPQTQSDDDDDEEKDDDDNNNTPPSLESLQAMSLAHFGPWLIQEQQSKQPLQQEQPSPIRSLQRKHHNKLVIVKHTRLHLSLSRPFFLQVASIDSLVTALQQRIQDMAIPPFVVRLVTRPLHRSRRRRHRTSKSNHNLQNESEFSSSSSSSSSSLLSCYLLVNDEQTRTFLSWRVEEEEEAATTSHLKSLVHAVDSVLQQYNQPMYYQPPLFHISVASTPGGTVIGKYHGSSPTTNNKDASQSNNTVQYWEHPIDHPPHHPLRFLVNQVHCTFGTTKHFVIPLRGGGGGSIMDR